MTDEAPLEATGEATFQAPFQSPNPWRNLLVALALVGLIALSGMTVRPMANVEAYTNLITGLACVALIFLNRFWVLAATAVGLALGVIGLPLFPEGHVGFAFLFSGAGGFYLAPLIMAALGGWLYQRELEDDGYPSPKSFVLGLLLGLLASVLLGTVWLAVFGERTSWANLLVSGTLWQTLSLAFQGLIAFSISFFVRNEQRKRAYWKRRLQEYRRNLDERERLLDARDEGRLKLDEGRREDVDVIRERERLRKREEEDDLPPWVRLD